MRKRTLEEFIVKSREVHGEKYDYSNTNYINNSTPVEITCPQHGAFTVTPKRHSHRKQGCPVCGIGALNYIAHTIQSRKTHEQFLVQSREVHGDKYDYSMCCYTGGKTKMPIICKQHGVFYQHAEGHVNARQGCLLCYRQTLKGRQRSSGYGISFFESYPEKKNEPAILYLARMQHANDNFLKIGITTRQNIKMRYYSHAKHGTVITPLVEQPELLYDAYMKEAQLLAILKPFRFFPNRKFSGYTECFKINKEVISFLESYFSINIHNLLDTK